MTKLSRGRHRGYYTDMVEPGISNRRRWLSPEVVQTSDTDCGPATLKCVLGGFGIQASYGRLREACQTDVDGTSINAVEDVAARLGLSAEQSMMPVDHVLLPEASALPAIVVVRLPDASTHFVVLWRRHGKHCRDYGSGHGPEVADGRAFPLSDVRALDAGVCCGLAGVGGIGAGGGRDAAAHDDVGRPRHGRARPRAHRHELARTCRARCRPSHDRRARPLWGAGLWARGHARRGTPMCTPRVHPRAVLERSARAGDRDQLTLRGAVLVQRVWGRQAGSLARVSRTRSGARRSAGPPRCPTAAPAAQRWGARSLALLSAMLFAAGGVIAEAVLLRGFLELGRELGLAGQRIAAVAALIAFFAILLALELPLTSTLFRYGRRLEIRLRQAFLEKIPRLSDRYFRSRLASDMAERSHTIHKIRHLPELGSQLVRSVFELVLTTAGIAWVDPASAPLAMAAAAVALTMPLVAQPVIMERDLRERTIGGALSRSYLDALLGLVPIRAHGAERAVRRGHARYSNGLVPD